jgi:hypothetical protein
VSGSTKELFHLIVEPVISHAEIPDNNLGSRLSWGHMADRQGLPQFLHAFECIGSVSHYLDQGIVSGLEKPPVDSHL